MTLRLGSLFSGKVAAMRAAGHGVRNLNETVTPDLLPTPTATPYGNNQSPSPGAVGLLPTPTANDWKGPGPRDRRPVGDDDLATRVGRLLPTPDIPDDPG